ncbi:MAG: hypothetical protein IJG87_07110 [Ruminococcus sp.]|nr:hypothetical protein [Ruminococcus sp.]
MGDLDLCAVDADGVRLDGGAKRAVDVKIDVRPFGALPLTVSFPVEVLPSALIVIGSIVSLMTWMVSVTVVLSTVACSAA